MLESLSLRNSTLGPEFCELLGTALSVIERQVGNTIQSYAVALVKYEPFVARKASGRVGGPAETGRAKLATATYNRVARIARSALSGSTVVGPAVGGNGRANS